MALGLPPVREQNAYEAFRGGVAQAMTEAEAAQQKFAQSPWGQVLGNAMMAMQTMGPGRAPPMGRNAPTLGIKAWHASPHRFEQFDLSKMGAGEGNQTYSPGLYFAESRDVSGPGGYYYNQFKNRAAGKAHSYEVDIRAKPEQFLDWDKPLSQQSASVREGIRKLPGGEDWLAAGEQGLSGAHLVEQMSGMYEPAMFMRMMRQVGIPGVRYLDEGSRAAVPREEIASRIAVVKRDIDSLDKTLADPTLTKHDQGLYKSQRMDLMDDLARLERAPDLESATRNYVVNDDSIVDILKRYGLLAAPAAGVLGMNAGREQ